MSLTSLCVSVPHLTLSVQIAKCGRSAESRRNPAFTTIFLKTIRIDTRADRVSSPARILPVTWTRDISHRTSVCSASPLIAYRSRCSHCSRSPLPACLLLSISLSCHYPPSTRLAKPIKRAHKISFPTSSPSPSCRTVSRSTRCPSSRPVSRYLTSRQHPSRTYSPKPPQTKRAYT